jgi:hypothetical protein
MGPDDHKVVSESEGIIQAIQLETMHGEYKWSQILKRDEVQTGRRVLLAYGIQFMNQMGGINLVVVSLTYTELISLNHMLTLFISTSQYYVTSGKSIMGKITTEV